MKLLGYSSLFAILAFSSITVKDNAAKVKDYFTLPGPIEFGKTSYTLSWSAHPSVNYFKQEYLPAGQQSASFNKMFMIEAVLGEVSLPAAVKAKINELEQRKKTDPLANYQLAKNPTTGEYLLDFIMSQSAAGKTAVAEWNAYRYVQLTGSGAKGIILFALSKRAYADDIPNFLKLLKTGRLADINLLATYPIPAIKIIND